MLTPRIQRPATRRCWPTTRRSTSVVRPNLVWADSAADVVDTVTHADADGTAVLVLGGGSNLIVADAGFDGLVVRVAHRGVAFENVDDHVVMHAAAGEIWDDIVTSSARRRARRSRVPVGNPGPRRRNTDSKRRRVWRRDLAAGHWRSGVRSSRSPPPSRCRRPIAGSATARAHSKGQHRYRGASASTSL